MSAKFDAMALVRALWRCNTHAQRATLLQAEFDAYALREAAARVPAETAADQYQLDNVGQRIGDRYSAPAPSETEGREDESFAPARAIVAEVRKQMRFAQNYLRPETGVWRFTISPTHLNVVLIWAEAALASSAVPASTQEACINCKRPFAARDVRCSFGFPSEQVNRVAGRRGRSRADAQGGRMTEKYDDNGKERPTRYFIGPFEDPSCGPKVLMCLESALDDLKSRFEEGEVGDELTYRIVEMTDAEAEKLPEL